MTFGGITAFAEMPNLGNAVKIYHKLSDANSLLVEICATNPFLELARMTVFRGEKELNRTDKLQFGEQLRVKYKYETLGKIDTKVELEKVLGKMHDIDERLQKINIQNEEDLQDKEQRDPNKGSVTCQGSNVNGTQFSKNENIVYYGQGMAVPVIRVKLPGSKKVTTIAPGEDIESQARFHRIVNADVKRIAFDKRRGEAAVFRVEHMMKEDIKNETEEEDTGKKEEDTGKKEELIVPVEHTEEKETIVPFEDSGAEDALVPFEDIPQLKL